MSDYLSKLVAINLDQADVVRPRLAARFESTQPTFGLAFATDIAQASEERAAPEEREFHAGRKPSEQDASAATLTIRQPSRFTAQVVQRPGPRRRVEEAPDERMPRRPTAVIPATESQPETSRGPVIVQATAPVDGEEAHLLERRRGSADPAVHEVRPSPEPHGANQNPGFGPNPSEPRRLASQERVRPSGNKAELRQAGFHHSPASITVEPQSQERASPVVGEVLKQPVIKPPEPAASAPSGAESTAQSSVVVAQASAPVGPTPNRFTEFERSDDRSLSTRQDQEAPASSQATVAPLGLSPHIEPARQTEPMPSALSHHLEAVVQQLAPPAAQPAPTIRVTIGRIEVRAATPSPKPPVQRSQRARRRPALSLDQYLQRRDGGRS